MGMPPFSLICSGCIVRIFAPQPFIRDSPRDNLSHNFGVFFTLEPGLTRSEYRISSWGTKGDGNSLSLPVPMLLTVRLSREVIQSSPHLIDFACPFVDEELRRSSCGGFDFFLFQTRDGVMGLDHFAKIGRIDGLFQYCLIDASKLCPGETLL